MIFRSASCVDRSVTVTEKRLRKPFAVAVAGAWLGIVGLLTFVFPASNLYSGRVVAISESAQIVVLKDGRPRSLRLAEIEFPQRGHFFAREARALANRLALGRDVNVEEARLGDGSRQAYVTLPGGRNLSAELVRAGLAWPSRRRAGRLASTLASLESGAMSDRRGVFSEPVTPSATFRVVRLRHASTLRGVELPLVEADSDGIEEEPLAETDATEDAAPATLGEN